MFAAIQHFDDAILAFIQENFQSPAMDYRHALFTSLGDIGLIWIFMAIALMVSKNTGNMASSWAYRSASCPCIQPYPQKPCRAESGRSLQIRYPAVDFNAVGKLFSVRLQAASSFVGAFCLAFADKAFAPFGYLFAVLDFFFTPVFICTLPVRRAIRRDFRNPVCVGCGSSCKAFQKMEIKGINVFFS